MQKWLAEQQKTIGSSTTDVDRQIKALRLKVQEIYGGNVDNPDTVGDSLINVARSGQGIQANVEQLAKRVEQLAKRVATLEGRNGRVSELSSEAIDTLTRSLRVLQTSVPVPNDFAGQTRKTYDLSFSLCTQTGDKCDEQGLDSVEKVIYRLDPRWFMNATETRINRADRFSFSIRVWGITKVTACIYVKGRPEQPIIRAAFMSLTEPQYLGAELPVPPYDCAT
jgi:hypothetical protein